MASTDERAAEPRNLYDSRTPEADVPCPADGHSASDDRTKDSPFVSYLSPVMDDRCNENDIPNTRSHDWIPQEFRLYQPKRNQVIKKRIQQYFLPACLYSAGLANRPIIQFALDRPDRITGFDTLSIWIECRIEQAAYNSLPRSTFDPHPLAARSMQGRVSRINY